MALGALLIFLGRNGIWLLGLIGGAGLGLGGAIMFITFAFMPLAEWTPWASLIAGVLIGLAATVRSRGKKPDAPETATTATATTATAASEAAPPTTSATEPEPSAPPTAPGSPEVSGPEAGETPGESG
jgi:predicted lipid-binding transport protein (Tim44 family)